MRDNQLSRYGAIAKSYPFLPTGRIFFAIHPSAEHVSSTAAGWVTDLEEQFPVDSDGFPRVFNTIQGAVDATTTGRGDIVFVGPGKWKEEVKVISKMGVKILGPMYNGMGTGWDGARLRPSDASTHYPFTTVMGRATNGAAFHVLSRGVEIAGFYLDGGGNYAGVYVGGGLGGGITGYTTENASGFYCHDNFFRGGNEGIVGLDMDGPRFGCKIENNYFERWTGAAIEISAGNANTENALIQYNTFAASSAGYGIDIYGAANVKSTGIHKNLFQDGASAAFTFGVLVNTGATGVTSVGRNTFCCANPMSLLVTDVHSGNSKGTLNTTEVYIDED